MNNDLISRQWLMECVNECWIKFDTEKDENRFIHLVRDIAPSAEPQRKKGTWVKTGQSFVYPNKFLGYSCSCCGFYIRKENPLFLFCPSCGSEMTGGDENDT